MSEHDYASTARFRTALRRFLRESETVSRAEGLTPRQYLLLLQIAAAGRFTTVSDLVERLVLTQSTVTELVQRAEQAGLVQRQPDENDARVVRLSLTADGAARLASVHAQLEGERERLRHLIDAH